MKPGYLIACAAYCAGIFWISSQPKPLGVNESPFYGSDKIAHMAVYGGLAALVSVGLRRSRPNITPRAQFWIPVLFAAAYGVTDEIHQYFVPERSFEFADMLANALGALAAQAVLCLKCWKLPVFARTQGA